MKERLRIKERLGLNRKSAALLAAAVVLLLGGGITGTRSALSVFSQDYEAWFYMNHLQVHLMENGEDICGGKNTLDAESKTRGELAGKLGYENGESGEKLGEAEPGKVYAEEVALKNGQDIDMFARMTVKKYWVKTDEEGNPERDEKGNLIKSTELSPDLIRLTYGASDGKKKARDQYNTDAWMINEEESSEESATYYCREAIGGGETSAPLFDRLMIDGQTARLGEVKTSEDGKVFTYEYSYDGYAFYIEADVQGIQTHNAEDAIHSQWGVYNVEAEGKSLAVEK